MIFEGEIESRYLKRDQILVLKGEQEQRMAEHDPCMERDS